MPPRVVHGLTAAQIKEYAKKDAKDLTAAMANQRLAMVDAWLPKVKGILEKVQVYEEGLRESERDTYKKIEKKHLEIKIQLQGKEGEANLKDEDPGELEAEYQKRHDPHKWSKNPPPY